VGVSSAVPSVPFARTASTGSHRGHRSHSLRVRHRRRPRTGKRRASHRRLRFYSSHVFAESVTVNVMLTRVGHQFFGHVVDGDHVLVFSGVLVALVGHVDHSGDFDVEGKLFPLCAFLCCLVSFKGCGLLCTHGLLGCISEDRCWVVLSTRHVSTHPRAPVFPSGTT
jgi:hypothetical protein